MERCVGRRRMTITLLVVIGGCGTLLFQVSLTAKLRLNKVQTLFGGDLYRNQRWKRLFNSALEGTTEPVLPKMRAPLSGRGYVVALKIWEQLLGGSRNLMQLQCWAGTLGSDVSVVEPFLLTNRSELGLSLASDSTAVSKLGLGILFDMSTWAQQWAGTGLLAPLVSREDLVSEVSQFEKLVILVEVKYLSLRQDAQCDFTWSWSVMEDLKEYQNLNVARNVCINLQRKISSNQFRSLVFGDLTPQNSLVIFKEWRGLGPRRVDIQLPSCTIQLDCHHIHLSDHVWKDAESYVNTYLGGIGQFISISARFEKMSRHYASMTMEQRHREIARIIPQAVSDVRELQKTHGVEKVHLAYDYGQFGSGSFKRHKYYNSEDMLIKFQSDLYKGTVSFAEYEESYRTLSSTNPAYVAVVQIVVSSMGKCLIQIGSGHVTNLIQELFMRTHQSPYCNKCIATESCH